MALVGSSRPLLELSSCTACKALEEEMALLKSTEQKEVCTMGLCVYLCARVCVCVHGGLGVDECGWMGVGGCVCVRWL